jgi:hypothetical protein
VAETTPLRRGRAWLKYGCLGIALLFLLGIAWSGLVVFSAWRGSRSEQVERHVLELPLSGDGRRAEASPEVDAGADTAVAAAPSSSRPVPPAGRVILELTVGEFTVEPGLPGEPVSVEGEFDTRAYALQERFEPAAGGEPWVYRVDFNETGLMRDGGLRAALFGASFPRLRVRIPPDVPLALEASFEKCGAQVDLGGLWLTDVEVDVEKGGLDLVVSRPLAAPVGRLEIHGKQGGLSARRLGNASPRVLVVDSRMGGASVDLGGAWLADAEVRVGTTLGGSVLTLPREARVVGDDLPFTLPPPRDEQALPTLALRVSTFLAKTELKGGR